MSLLCRSGKSVAALLASTAVMVLAGVPAGAAQVYYQPTVTLATGYNTNVGLDPLNGRSAEGYFANASTLLGIATPTSETILEPRLLYNYYPSESDLNRLEAFLSLNGRYSWQRDRFTITGYFDHRDDINAEQPSAVINPVTPTTGDQQPTSGRTQFDITRNWLILDPTYSHLITPLQSIGVGGEYQRLSYSPDDTSSHINFNYYMGKVFYAWTQNPRTDYTLNAFGARYVAGSIEANSTSGGVSGEMKYRWTPALQSSFSASYQRIKFEETDPRTVDETSNNWGASIATTYTGVISKYTLALGRSIVPNASGGLFATDQVRGQYDRDFTQRLHFTGAVRYFRDHSVSGVSGSDTRNYLSSFVKLQWMMTRRIFIAGSYSYIYQKYRSDPDSADANIVQIQFGYKGIERQR